MQFGRIVLIETKWVWDRNISGAGSVLPFPVPSVLMLALFLCWVTWTLHGVVFSCFSPDESQLEGHQNFWSCLQKKKGNSLSLSAPIL